MTKQSPSVVETHISTLFLTEDRVYKLLKPVANGFLDHRCSASRIDAANKEIKLNRRLAPDVYLGDAAVIEDGELVDRMIVMQRLPADRSLTAIIRRGELSTEIIRSLARTIAVFHASLSPETGPTVPGSLQTQRQNWEDSFREMEPFVGHVLDAADNNRIVELVRTYLDTHGELFDRRITEGCIRDGHGDLLADDIFVLDDGPRILDCLAFRDDLRIGDVLSDVAFLAMDLHRLAGPDAARELMRHYQEFTAEKHPASLAHHYVAYRAHIRSKVACLRWQQGEPQFAAVARMYHRLALDQLERAEARLVLVGGGPGTGKTTVANGLAELFGWTVLSSDLVRKNLATDNPDSHHIAKPDVGIYTADITDATYDELVREAKVLLGSGESVVLDASWTSAKQRDKAAEVAAEAQATFIAFECQVDPAVARERVARRLADGWSPSDATPEIVDHLAALHDPWDTARPLDTSRELQVTIAEAVASILNRDIAAPSPVVSFWGDTFHLATGWVGFPTHRDQTALESVEALEALEALEVKASPTLAISTPEARLRAEVQDTVLQRLFAIGVDLHLLTSAVVDPQHAHRLQRAIDLLDGALQDTRSLVEDVLVDDISPA